IVKWGDNPDNFVQLDWFRIADADKSLVEKQFQAGTIVSVADKKVVKLGDEATPVSFTPSLNIYRPISFAASEEDKEKFFLVTPQDGEKAKVRGRYTNVAGNNYLTDNNGRKVAFLNNTSVEFVDRDDQWYEVECYINKNEETGIYDLVVFGAQVATGVESVETANATVFAANGTINVSSDAQAAIEVYTANGQMVSAINADNASIAVAPGFYLVKVGNQVSKVVVK
ncbi:MAG: T9SS type A sorting domain-containing protein, partial [Muribaculaceae bacterium]|nr:T9SS type A sorting domain-containing protein [Muribaculaceae bacterium]